jgi:hypothetical protein
MNNFFTFIKKTYFQKLFTYLVISSLGLFTGCGFLDNGPSQEDISRLVKTALTTQFNNVNNSNPLGGILSKIIGTDQLIVNKIEKVDCKNAREKIFTCEVFVDYDIGTQDQPIQPGGEMPPFKSNQKIQKTMTFNFFKSGSGWLIAN